MFTGICPRLPMRKKAITKDYYVNKLGFEYIGSDHYEFYLIVQKDDLQIHFFEHVTLNPLENYGQVYIRTNKIDELYQLVLPRKVSLHLSSPLQSKPWGQREFSLHDPDNNLITFGMSL
jgi:catechol 2,3-dioxygenase-like lactoylglutathione lyase family enzyme